MSLISEDLLDTCEEFFSLIANEKKDADLEDSIESLREFIEKDVDGWTNHTDEELAHAIQCRLFEIWNLISAEEKSINPNLEDYYDEIISQLESASGFEMDFDNEWGEGEP